MQLEGFFDKACNAINLHRARHEDIAKRIIPLKMMSAPKSAEKVIERMEKASLNFAVAGVDSGFVSKKLSFVDIVLVRTAGVLFDFEKNEIKKTTYYPSAFSLPEPLPLKLGLEKDEEAQSVSLERLKQEVSTSIKMIEKFKPKYLFIDGSIVPQYQDKPRKDSVINEDYESIIQLFQKLYSTAENNSCTLIACVEDSRGTRFRQLLQDEIIPGSMLKVSPAELGNVFDASILDYFLSQGERTFVFPYTSSIEAHAILKDYSSEWAKSIYVSYTKPSEMDKPLRIEFICKEGKSDPAKLARCAKEISSVVYALSSFHREYSYPSILIEADMRAGLNEQDISVVYDKLVDKLGPKARMRRNSRPFK
ncbi:MAG: DNA double-strand break repair nuclease NurA [archaeon]